MQHIRNIYLIQHRFVSYIVLSTVEFEGRYDGTGVVDSLHAEVPEPAELRAEVKRQIKEMREFYRGKDKKGK